MKYIATSLFLSISLSVFSQNSIVGTWTGIAFNRGTIIKSSQELIFTKEVVTINTYKDGTKTQKGTFEYQLNDTSLILYNGSNALHFNIIKENDNLLKIVSNSPQIKYTLYKSTQKNLINKLPLYTTFKISTQAQGFENNNCIFSKREKGIVFNIFNENYPTWSRSIVNEATFLDFHHLEFPELISNNNRINNRYSNTTSSFTLLKVNQDTIFGLINYETPLTLVKSKNKRLITKNQLTQSTIEQYFPNEDYQYHLSLNVDKTRKLSIGYNYPNKLNLNINYTGNFSETLHEYDQIDNAIKVKSINQHYIINWELSNDGQFLFIYYDDTTKNQIDSLDVFLEQNNSYLQNNRNSNNISNNKSLTEKAFFIHRKEENLWLFDELFD